MAADFPFVRSVVVVRSEVTIKKTGKTTTESRYYLSSAEPHERTPAQWHGLVRGHWGGVEIRNHWRRDAIWGEDGSRTRDATALANLALLRNTLLALLPDHYTAVSLPEIHEHLHSDPAACLRIIASK
jgi:predicted transposase YbfD/YdcC